MDSKDKIFEDFLGGKQITEFDRTSMSDSEIESLNEIQILTEAAEAYNYSLLKDKIKSDVKQINQKRKTYRLLSTTIFFLTGTGIGVYFFAKNENKTDSLKPQIEAVKTQHKTAQVPVLKPEKSATIQNITPIPKAKTLEKVADQNHKKQREIIEKVNSSFVKIENSISTFTETIPMQKDLKLALKQDVKAFAQEPKPCIDVKSQLKQQISPSCIGQNNGEINVAAIPGIIFQYKDAEFQKIDLTNLPSDNYIIYTRENNNCSDSLHFFVPEKKCVETNHYNYNPTYDSPILFKCNNYCKFELKDKSGITLLSQNRNSTYGFEFNAKDAYGVDLKPGTYIYIIIENETPIEVGQITIVN